MVPNLKGIKAIAFDLDGVATDGGMSYTIPVEALDEGIACAAYSKNKDQWYARTLLFRYDSLEAAAQGVALQPGDVAYRCNMASLEEGDLPFEERRILSHSSGGIDGELSKRLVEDLKADSANVMVLIMDLEDAFNMTVDDTAITTLRTVGDVVKYIEANQ